MRERRPGIRPVRRLPWIGSRGSAGAAGAQEIRGTPTTLTQTTMKTEKQTETVPYGLRNAQAATAQTLEWINDYDTATAGGDTARMEEIEQEIQEDPLSIEWGAWTTDPTKLPEWDQVRILLTTGGPALRLIAGLKEDYARLEWQDWGTPWTKVPLTCEEENAWLRYVGILGVDAY